jgi:hypothetical protein
MTGAREVVALACIAASLASCKPAATQLVAPAGATRTDFARDRYECMRDTQSSGAGAEARAAADDSSRWQNQGPFGAVARTMTSANATAERQEFFDACMAARGYSR